MSRAILPVARAIPDKQGTVNMGVVRFKGQTGTQAIELGNSSISRPSTTTTSKWTSNGLMDSAVTVVNNYPAAAGITYAGNTYAVGDPIFFSPTPTSTALPTGITSGTKYYVSVAGTTFNISATLGGPSIVLNSTGTSVKLRHINQTDVADPDGVRGNVLKLEMDTTTIGSFIYVDPAAGEFFDFSGDARFDIYLGKRAGNGDTTDQGGGARLAFSVTIKLFFETNVGPIYASMTVASYVKGWVAAGGRITSLGTGNLGCNVQDRGCWGFTGGSNPNWARVARIKIEMYHPAGSRDDYILLGDARQGYHNRLKLAWTKDDMSASDVDAYNLLYGTYGWPCTIACITNKLGSPPYSIAQANTMYANGWDYCNHSMGNDAIGGGHTMMSSYTSEERYTQLLGAEEALAAQGWTRALKIVILPGGGASTASSEDIAAMGFKTALTYGEGGGAVVSGPYSPPPLQIVPRRAMDGTAATYGVADTSATILASVDRAIATGGALVIGYHTLNVLAMTGVAPYSSTDPGVDQGDVGTTNMGALNTTTTNYTVLANLAAGIRQRELAGLLDVVSLVDIVNDRC